MAGISTSDTIRELNEEICNLKHQNYVLSSEGKTALECMVLAEKNAKLSKELRELYASHDKLKTDTLDVVAKAEIVKIRNDKYENRINTLETQLTDNEDCIVRLTQDNDEMCSNVVSLTNKITELEKLIESLCSNELANELVKLKAQNDDLLAENKQLVENNATLTDLNATLNAQLNECTESLKVQKKILITANEKLNEYKAAERVEENIAETKEPRDTSMDKFLVGMFDKNLSDEAETKEKLLSPRYTFRTETDFLKHEVTKHRTQNAALSDELKRLKRHNAFLVEENSILYAMRKNAK